MFEFKHRGRSWISSSLSVCRSAFFVFCSEYRPSVKQQYPGLSIGDCAKKLGEMWSKLSQSEKLPYEEKAQKLREKYDRVRLSHTDRGHKPVTVCDTGRYEGCDELRVHLVLRNISLCSPLYCTVPLICA